MPFLSRRPPDRVPHVEPGFCEEEFVAEYGAETGKFPAEFQWILSFVESHLDPDSSAEVLEIGSGPGWMAILLAKSRPGIRVTGIDISPAFVELANANSRHEGLADRVNFIVGDAAKMEGLGDGSFDVVMSNQSLHYWDAPERVFDQIARVLKRAGVFCIGDDRRDLNWQGQLQVFVGKCLLSRRIGSSWARSVSGCLTPDEAAAILAKSKLCNHGQVEARSRTMLISGTAAH